MNYLHDTPFEIERATDDESEYFAVYMIDYHYEAPSGAPLHKCDTPAEVYGEEDYEFVILDDFGNRVAMELTCDEERDFLKFFFEQMED